MILNFTMILLIKISILSLLLSNAVTLRRDLSILFNRIAIIALIYSILHEVTCLFILSKGVGLHGGLLHITNITQTFHVFIFFISILILLLTNCYSCDSAFLYIIWVDQLVYTIIGVLYSYFAHYTIITVKYT